MDIDFDHSDFQTQDGVRTALVVRPTQHIRVLASRLQELRRRDPESADHDPIDEHILRRIRAERGKSRVCIIRGRGASDDGTSSYAFESGIDIEAARELAYYLLRQQLPIYRAMAGAGMCLCVHTEWPNFEVDLFRDAVARRLEELDIERKRELRLGRSAVLQRVDTWIASNFVFFFSLKVDKLLSSILPQKLYLMESRIGALRDMLDELDSPGLSGLFRLRSNSG